MQHRTKGAVAGLLVSAILMLPASALAMTESATDPMPTVVNGTSKEPPAEGLVAVKVTRDEAIAIAKKHFAIPADLGEPNVSTQQSRTGASWAMDWQSPSKSADQVFISVIVDAVNGNVLHYSYSKNQPDAALQLSYTRDEAKAVAEEWLAKLVPAEYRTALRMIDSPMGVSYYGGSAYEFAWMRMAGEHGVAQDGVSFTVDASTGQMVGYRLNWQADTTFVLPEKLLSRAEAEAAYRKQPMVLQYMEFAKRGTDEREWRLVYQPLTGQFEEMDQSGNLIDWDGKPVDLTRLSEYSAVPAPAKPYKAPAKPLSQEEALAVAKAISGQKSEPTSSNYSENGESEKRLAWEFSWFTEATEDQSYSNSSVQIDAATGLVTNFYAWSEQEPFAKGEKAPVSLADAQAKAVEFIRSARPDLAGNLRMELFDRYGSREGDYQPPSYSIGFQFMKNGLPVANREARVEIDARSGEVRGFWSSGLEDLSKVEFPSAKAGITAEEAMKVFLENQGIASVWSSFGEYGEATQTMLVWAPSTRLSIQTIDATSGAPLDWEGRNLIEATRRPTDIAGHFAEREIELLWARGVFDLKDGKFNPNEAVSVEDLARWIILARGLRPFYAYDFYGARGLKAEAATELSTNSASAYFGAAMQNGIILPEDFEGIEDLSGPISRELFALWASRAMGYGRIATMGAKIEMAFADKGQVSPKYANAVAILGGLGIVSADVKGNFNPQRSLTRGEAAEILFATSVQR